MLRTRAALLIFFAVTSGQFLKARLDIIANAAVSFQVFAERTGDRPVFALVAFKSLRARKSGHVNDQIRLLESVIAEPFRKLTFHADATLFNCRARSGIDKAERTQARAFDHHDVGEMMARERLSNLATHAIPHADK